MLYTKEHVRDNIRNREGKRVFYLGKGDQLTSEARDYLAGERIEILPGDRAKPQQYVLLSGATLEEKPEHMTHLKGNVLVPKTHPRIAFRGAVDTLEGELLLCIPQTEGAVRRQLEEILAYTRSLIRWDVLEEPVQQETLCGLTPGEIRERSHFPQKFYGIPHFMPSPEDGLPLLLVNRVRCAARNAELRAVDAFTDREGNPTRKDLLQAMNRLSSMLYLVMLQLKAGGKE